MASYNKVSETMYKAVKILLKGGASTKEAAEYMKLSTATVYKVNETEDYAEFLQISEVKRAKRVAAIKAKEQAQRKEEQKQEAQEKPQVIEHRQTVQVQATHYMTEELREIKTILKGISAKMAFIVNDLYGDKTKEEGSGE